MAFNPTAYNPPGVYVQDQTTPIVTSTGVPAAYACIVGPALGYQTSSETVLIYASEVAVLAHRGAFTEAAAGPPVVSAPVVTKLDGTVLTEDTDYTFAVDTSGLSGNVVSISRVSSSTNVADGDAVTVVYEYAEDNYYQPQVFTDYQTLANTYGVPMVGATQTDPNASQVVSPLSMGAKIAFENGAGTLICLATNPADGNLREQFVAAYNKLAANYSANLIVPVFPDDLVVGSGAVATAVTGYAQDLKNHCVQASNNGYGRIGFFGTPRNYEESTQPMDVFAETLGSKRIVLAYPTTLQVFNGSTNQTADVAGCYLAAAMAGLLSALPTNTGLTNQRISSFSGLNSAIAQKMTTLFKNTLSSNGVAVAELNQISLLRVRHGVTTDMSALTTREISMIRIADALYEQVQLGMENAGLIGQPIDGEMVMRVKGALQSILEASVLNETIVSYTGLSAQQQIPPNGDPSVIACSFSYQPAIPLNYITVSFQIDLNTGDITDTSTVTSTATTAS